jgi:uncharacterized membrane protein YbhN (UPF0104 family)
VTALLLSITGYYLAYLALALAVLGLLWIGRDVTPLIAVVMTVFFLVAIAIPALALIAFIMASIVVTLGPIPRGLGSFEATGIAMLTLLGVPLEAAVAGILLLRGLTLWIPLVPGLVLTRHDMVRRPRPRRD